MAAPYAGHWDMNEFKNAPALLLNTTEVDTGNRRVIAPFEFIGTGDLKFFPLSSEPSKGRTASLPLSTAAVLSARFAWITPPGWVGIASESPSAASRTELVDGGYCENSGVATALDLIKALDRDLRQRDFDQKFEITLIILTSGEFAPSGVWGTGEVLGPIQTMLKTREARASIEIDRAKAELQSMASDRVRYRTVKVKLSGEEYPLPLGWRLSTTTKYLIDYQGGSRAKCNTPPEPPFDGNPDCPKALFFQQLSHPPWP